MNHERGDGFPIEQRQRQGQGHVAVVVNATAETEGLPFIRFLDARYRCQQETDADSDCDGDEADGWREQEIARILGCGIAQQLVEDEAGDQQIDRDLQEALIGDLVQAPQAAHQHAGKGGEEHREHGEDNYVEFLHASADEKFEHGFRLDLLNLQQKLMAVG